MINDREEWTAIALLYANEGKLLEDNLKVVETHDGDNGPQYELDVGIQKDEYPNNLDEVLEIDGQKNGPKTNQNMIKLNDEMTNNKKWNAGLINIVKIDIKKE